MNPPIENGPDKRNVGVNRTTSLAVQIVIPAKDYEPEGTPRISVLVALNQIQLSHHSYYDYPRDPRGRVFVLRTIAFFFKTDAAPGSIAYGFHGAATMLYNRFCFETLKANVIFSLLLLP